MGYKDICLTCRKAFNRGTDFNAAIKKNCPGCGGKTVSVSHLFQPPKKTAIKKWEVVSFLVKKGFRYNHAYKHLGFGMYQQYGRYPENMKDAIDFVQKFEKDGI